MASIPQSWHLQLISHLLIPQIVSTIQFVYLRMITIENPLPAYAFFVPALTNISNIKRINSEGPVKGQPFSKLGKNNLSTPHSIAKATIMEKS